MLGMPNTTAPGHGPALAEFLTEMAMREPYGSVRAFTTAIGLEGENPKITEWARGGKPSWESIRRFADALHLPVGNLLVAAKMVDPAELTVVPMPQADVQVAIENDPRLDEDDRRTLLHVVDLILHPPTRSSRRTFKAANRR